MHVHVVFSKASLTIFANISIFARVGCHVMRRKNLLLEGNFMKKETGKSLQCKYYTPKLISLILLLGNVLCIKVNISIALCEG